MKVYLLKDIENVGMSGEIVKVKEGFALNFLIPRKMALRLTAKNENFYRTKARTVVDRKEVISSKTSLLAEKIKTIKLTLKRKMHDDGKLYASVNPAEIVDLLATEGVSVSKSQIKITKAIKEKGIFPVTVKLTSKLQPALELKVVSEGA